MAVRKSNWNIHQPWQKRLCAPRTASSGAAFRKSASFLFETTPSRSHQEVFTTSCKKLPMCFRVSGWTIVSSSFPTGNSFYFPLECSQFILKFVLCWFGILTILSFYHNSVSDLTVVKLYPCQGKDKKKFDGFIFNRVPGRAFFVRRNWNKASIWNIIQHKEG